MTAGAATLHIRRVGIDTWRENVAFLHRDCPVVRAAGFVALAKVTVHANGRSIAALLNVVDDDTIVGPLELGLGEEAFRRLGVDAGQPAQVEQAEPPRSMAALHRKIAGDRLSRDDLLAVMQDVAAARYSKIELAAFVVATNQFELDRDEVLNLTEAMIAVGQRIDWRPDVGDGPVVDKHCIGGIPGNRTSMLVVPIVTAHGLWCPKTSSRAITSPAGTADTMEVLAEVELPLAQLQQIVRHTRGCLAWGGTADLSPADDILISVERPLAIDSPGQMVASILSKKVAAGSTHLVLDIPVGPTAKVRSMPEAQRLKKLFEYVAGGLGLQLDAVITDGRQPIGRGIGPVLEALDVLQVLSLHPDAPQDLRRKSLLLAGRVIEFDPAVRGGDGWRIARGILDDGRALAQMNALIDAQGRRTPLLRPAPLSFEVRAASDGVVTGIDNLRLARVARLAGAPQVQDAGVWLACKLGEPVRVGQLLYRLHARHPADLAFARRLAEADSGYRIGRPEDVPPDLSQTGLHDESPR